MLSVASLSACATAGSGGGTVLEGTTWRIAEMDGQRVLAPEDSDLTPHFRIVSAEGRVHGATGCNRFSGIYRADGTMLAFGQVNATRMACTDPQLQAQETRLMEILRVADRYVIQDRWLWIMAGGQHRLTAEIW
jgi:heat shock protein HslJ